MRPGPRGRRRSWLVLAGVLIGVGAAALARPAAASNAAVGLSGAAREAVRAPQWLYLATGGAVVGASALVASLATDRAFIRAVHTWRARLAGRSPGVWARWAGRVLGLGALALVLVVGATGPQVPTLNAAVVVVFAGWRAALTMGAYLVGNPWPAIDPWRTLARAVPSLDRSYPDRLARWPAVAGLLALVWLETVTPVTRRPAALAVAVLAYTGYTLLGSAVVGPSTWFRHADPIAAVFRFYGTVAPLERTDAGLSVRLPGMGLVTADLVRDRSDAAIAIALVFELTFSGFVTTPPGVAAVRTLVGVGLPPLAVYTGLLVGGYAAFLVAYVLAARGARRTAETLRSPRWLERAFAPPLVAIAAGYHLAHYAGFLVSLLPSLAWAVTTPFAPPANPVVLALPAWFGGLDVAFVLAGHLLAVWIAHSIAYEAFPSRLQAIRSQYPFVAVMVGFTVLSLWLVSLPTVAPPFL